MSLNDIDIGWLKKHLQHDVFKNFIYGHSFIYSRRSMDTIQI